ncbi:MAG: hypothetical protein LBN40_01650 [Oscillospiraceae bacterium]|jgi:Ger(x)C family germination protein|nr:hypothetical protein [Oscillospiraceae bacterium]
MQRIISLVLAAILFTGCVPHVELNDRLIIQAIGIDYKDGEYTVVFQFIPGGSHSSGGEVSPSAVLNLVSGKGISIVHAIMDIEKKTGKPPLLGSAEVIILGGGLKDEPISYTLDFFSQGYEFHPFIKVAISETTAEDVLLALYTDEEVGVQRLQRVLEDAEHSGLVYDSTVHSVNVNMSLPLSGAIIPLFRPTKTTDHEGKEVRDNLLVGGAVFTDDLYVGDVDLDVMTALCWLYKTTGASAVTVDGLLDSPIAGLWDIKSVITPVRKDDNLHLKIKTTAVAEISRHHADENTISKEDEWAAIIADAMDKQMNRAFEISLHEYGCDVLRLEPLVRQKNNRLWRELHNEFDTAIRTCTWEFDTDVTILQFGISAW